MLNTILTQLGLSEKEAKIYEAALDSGPESVQKIARCTDITRTAAYKHIRSLIKKGLMGSMTRDKKTYFFAEPPENLSTLVDARKKDVRQLSTELQKTMPRLRLLFETSEDRPRVRFFEGRDGLKTMVNDLMKSRFESLEEFAPLDELHAFTPPQPNDYRDKINKKFKKIPMRVIYTSDSGPILKAKEGLKERRFLSKDKFPCTGGITIYGNKVSLISHKKAIAGVIIENKEIVNTLRSMFNLAWEATLKYKK